MKIRVLIVAVAAIAIVGFVTGPFTSPLAAQDSGPKNLFAQYYTPSGASQSHAGMYPAPHPVPRNVGHTYYTYQPLMPHEMLYTHSRNYFNYHAGPDAFYCNGCNGSGGGSGYTKTTVKWQSGNMHIGPLPFSRVPFQQLHYNWSKFRHNAGSGQGGLLGGALQSGGLGGGLGSRGGGGCLSGNCLGSLGAGSGAGAGTGGAGFGDGGFGDGFDGGGGFGNGNGNGGSGGFGDPFGGGGSLSPGCGCDGGQFAGADPARMSSVAADNSWAQKAAAATASLVNGRVQR